MEKNEYVIVSKIRDKQLLRIICYRVFASCPTEAVSIFLKHQDNAIAWDVYSLESTSLENDV